MWFVTRKKNNAVFMHSTFELARRCGAPVPYSHRVVAPKLAGTTMTHTPCMVQLLKLEPADGVPRSVQHRGPVAGVGPGMCVLLNTPLGGTEPTTPWTSADPSDWCGVVLEDNPSNMEDANYTKTLPRKDEEKRLRGVAISYLRLWRRHGSYSKWIGMESVQNGADFAFVLIASAVAKWAPDDMDARLLSIAHADIAAMFDLPEKWREDYNALRDTVVHSSGKTLRGLEDAALWRVPEREDISPACALGSVEFDGASLSQCLQVASQVFL